jgi:hypothetical protein
MQIIAVFLATACGAACGTLVDDDYAGEPLFRLQGIAASTQSDVTRTGVKGAAFWQHPDPAASALTRLPLVIEFPTFWIDVLSPPRDAVTFRIGPDEPAIGEAYLHIVNSDTGPAPGSDDFLATDYDHVLVYAAGAVAPGSPTADYLGAALAPGFHVLLRSSTDELSGSQQVLVERCVAAAPGDAADRARASCTALHSYRLAPAPGDLTALLRFHLVVKSTR